MKKVLLSGSIFVASILSFVIISSNSRASSSEPQPLPSIPGITVKDTKPNSCVDCHKLYTQPRKFDGRLTTHMKEWEKEVSPELLAKAQRTMPEGIKLEGKHPDVSSFVKNIPQDCLACHNSSSKRVPQFKKLVHVIHLTGEDNHFIQNYQGQCTYCHKLDMNTGEWGFGTGKAEW